MAFRSRARTNGATTFRRPSLANNLSNQRDAVQTGNPSPSSGVYVPPHLNSNYQSSYGRNGITSECRYSKDQLLDLFRAQGKSGQSNSHITDLFVDGWSPVPVNDSTNGGWGKKEEHKDGSNGPDICWDYEGKVQPLSLTDMTDHEKEVTRKQDHLNAPRLC